MSGPKPVEIALTEKQRSILEKLTRRLTSPQRLVWRSQIILLADEGQNNKQIASQLGLARHTVRCWRKRWVSRADAMTAVEEQGEKENKLTDVMISVLNDSPRAGAPGTLTPEQIVHIVAIACTPPQACERPITHWSHRELAHEVIKRQIVPSISPRSVGRFLKSGGFTPASQSLLAQRPN